MNNRQKTASRNGFWSGVWAAENGKVEKFKTSACPDDRHCKGIAMNEEVKEILIR